MNFNNVEIDISTDYTAFTNTVTFSLTVPISETDAQNIYKSMQDKTWAETETAITKAITDSAPSPVQKLASSMMNAYTGKTGGQADTGSTPSSDKDSTGNTSGGSGDNSGDTTGEAGNTG